MAQNSKGAYLNVLQDADGKDVYPITRADGVYLNDGTTAQAKCEALDSKIDSTKSSLQTSFQAGVDGIYSAITAQGTTPVSKSQGDVQSAIKTLADAKYAAGNSAGVASVTVSASASGRTVTATASNGKTASASVALAGSNGTVSVSTAGGSGNQSFDIQDGWCTNINVDRSGAYNQGVTDADNRVNSSSTNYKGGYNAGYGAGKGAAGNITLYATGNCTSDPNQGAGTFLVIPGALSALYSRADVTACVRANPWQYGALNDRKDVPNQSFAFNGRNYTSDATASFSLGSEGLTLSAQMNGGTAYGSCVRIAAYLHN